MTDELIIMKLGGSLITNKKSEKPECYKNIMRKIANIVSISDKKIIIVHGAGSYGHPIVKKYNIDKGIDGTVNQKEAILKARAQLIELNEIFCKEIKNAGRDCVSVIPSKTMSINNDGKLQDFPKDKFDDILSRGKIAITFGDIVNNKNKNVGVLSGDTLLLKLAQLYKPKRAFFIMDYPGVVKGNLNSNNIEIYDEINSDFISNISIHSEKNRPDVTGGLLNKIRCALEISKNCECWISGLDYLENCVNDVPRGTKVIV
tara:strand:+ start:7374 stop:8153 length:780 start_codon:yes stop_codon:yes gene_type:complete